MHTTPVPLSSSNQSTYDELYELFGKAEADKFALSFAATEKERATPVAPVATTPTPAATPVPVTLQIGTSPSGRPTVRALPVGMEPRTPPPPITDIKISAPSREELVKMGEAAAESYRKRRISELMATGLTMTEAEQQPLLS